MLLRTFVGVTNLAVFFKIWDKSDLISGAFDVVWHSICIRKARRVWIFGKRSGNVCPDAVSISFRKPSKGGNLYELGRLTRCSWDCSMAVTE